MMGDFRLRMLTCAARCLRLSGSRMLTALGVVMLGRAVGRRLQARGR